MVLLATIRIMLKEPFMKKNMKMYCKLKGALQWLALE